MQNQQDKKLVSFIIPVYDVPLQMLKECIQSIRALSLRSFEREIIIVDDGSTLSPLSALTELDDIVYIRQKNSGVAVARNTGIKMAEGKYIQFIDADDVLLRAPYEHVLDMMRYSNSDMVMFDFSEDGQTTTVDFKDEGPLPGATLLRQSNIHGSVCCYLFRQAILGSLRFTPGVAYGEDEEFTPQLILRADSVTTTNARAYFYRQRPMSAINRADMRSHIARLSDARDVIMNLRKKSSTLPPEERVAMQRRIAQLTMDYIYNIIILTRSRHYLDRKLEELRKVGLFPLPDRDYTNKYKWFRRMTKTSVGITMLMRTLPLLNKER